MIKDFIRNIFHVKPLERERAEDSPIRSGGINIFNNIGGRAMNVSTVYRCVDMLANGVATIPLHHEIKRGTVFTVPEADGIDYLLTVEPNEYSTAVDFWKYVVNCILLKGNAYVVPLRDQLTGEVWRLAAVNPDNVRHDTTQDTYTIRDVKAAIAGTFDENQVIHVKNITEDGKVGISTLQYARMTTNIAKAGDCETLERFENGGALRGIVSEGKNGVQGFGHYQDQQIEQAATDIDAKFRGGQRIIAMPGTTAFSPITLSSQDMQFLESKKQNGIDICRFFNVPPQLAFHDTSSNYKSSEMAWVAFLNSGLAPLLKNIESEFNRKLMGREKHGRERIKFDRDEMYACDLESKAKYQAATIAAGIYTVNEWRAKENKKPIEGGDHCLVSANLKNINDISMTGEDQNDSKKIK